ncbi:MAG TPA: HupE/UreJ family protein [Hyphomicrobiaceae bacterium]|nr:HupE/UreJ family protein [Hyphomicrobiaceae bacterium]
MTPTRKISAALAALMMAVTGATPALAHTGLEHATSFWSGFLHPLTGPDHVLAMVAVGLWAGVNGGRAVWAWPVAFVSVMLVGGALGTMGLTLPLVEPGILASVIVLGLLVLTAARVPVAVGALLVGVFAVLHGHAHGAELPAAAAAISYSAGFALATALLHAVGLGIAFLPAREGSMLVRAAGGLVAACGIALAVI